jgi:thymidylate synthase
LKIRASSLDDLLHEVYERLLKRGRIVVATKGEAREAIGVLIELSNPRARLSSSEGRQVLFSSLGEFLWYLSGSDDYDFIKYYIPKYKPDGDGISTVRAAYGPRLKSDQKDQIQWVISLLKDAARSTTRRAVIPIFSESDTYPSLPEVPCTCTLQFFLRHNRLEMVTYMRSNDAYRGLPSDIFSFTLIQELIARALGVELGKYRHMIGNLHLYTADNSQAMHFLDEGWQSRIPMPPMPLGDPFEHLREVIRLEKVLRESKDVKPPKTLPSFWQDIVQLLRIYKAHHEGTSSRSISNLSHSLHSDTYRPYIDAKHRNALQRERASTKPPEQPSSLFEKSMGESL